MRSAEEIRELQNILVKLTGYLVDHADQEQLDMDDMEFANNTVDVLSWVLGDIESEDFRDHYLLVDSLLAVAARVEEASGVALDLDAED